MDRKQHYLSYLLRLWQAGSGTEIVWRASLQSPHSGELRGFPSLEALVKFLRRQMGSTLWGDGVDGGTPRDEGRGGGDEIGASQD